MRSQCCSVCCRPQPSAARPRKVGAHAAVGDVAGLDLLHQLVLRLDHPPHRLLARLLQLPRQQQLVQDEVGLQRGSAVVWGAVGGG